ncbi:hypothetical protein F4808DRAFT_313185 [Astrocystis sublimbata]|nr:hypothetical protein F4808DRAFT_313185 [Astrocystis sublimbata]
MTPSSSTRLLVKTTSALSSPPLSLRSIQQSTRAFSQTCRRHQDDGQPPPPRPAPRLSLLSRLSPSIAPRATERTQGSGSMADITKVLASNTLSRAMNQSDPNSIMGQDEDDAKEDWGPGHEPFHFHIFSHKHNTHITVTKPNRCAIVSMSAGQIGFKKSKRGSYDAAYQLAAYVLDKLNQGGWHRKIQSLEVVLRGFGLGREAVTKVLLGNEGKLLRPHIVKVADATRLKFGGTRGSNPRRLG